MCGRFDVKYNHRVYGIERNFCRDYGIEEHYCPPVQRVTNVLSNPLCDLNFRVFFT